jgi:periplasmic protein TonB
MATTRAAWRAAPMVALSVALHGAAFASLARARPAPARERIEIEVVRRERSQPPPPAPETAPPPRPRPAEHRTALARPLPPPPALASAPPEAPPAPRVLPRVGLSLGSTVSSGAFAVGVGNTLHGKAEETAADPATVRPYSGGAVAAARLSAQPRPLDLPRIEYPADARKAGAEGRVLLVLGIDAQGKVTSVRVLEAPSPSLASAALEGARRFRFTPALLEGAPVATEIRFTYTFLLE